MNKKSQLGFGGYKFKQNEKEGRKKEARKEGRQVTQRETMFANLIHNNTQMTLKIDQQENNSTRKWIKNMERYHQRGQTGGR